MSEGETLFLLLAVFSLAECACRVDAQGVLLRSFFGLAPWPVFPGGPLASPRGGIRFACPLPPLDPPFLLSAPPYSLSPTGATASPCVAPGPESPVPEAAPLLPWDGIRETAAEDRRVLLDGRPFATAATPAAARVHASFLARVAAAPETRRAEVIEAGVAAMLDTAEARRRVEAFRRETAGLRLAANLLFLVLFAGIPLAARSVAPSNLWAPALIVLAGLDAAVAALYALAHRRLRPGETGDLLRHLPALLLFPPAALRAADLLSRPLLADLHPLAGAAALCGKEAFRDFARRLLRDAAHPRPAAGEAPSAEAAAAAAWFRGCLRARYEAVVRGAGEDPAALLAPDPPAHPSERARCPRCGAAYEAATGDCADCRVPLRAV